MAERGIELGIIAGARILKDPIIRAFPIGIINFHPGLIPEARGLDALLWSVYKGVPLGVTAHLIDSRVDLGRILVRETIPIYGDDTMLDLSERLHEKQLELLPKAIELAVAGKWTCVAEPGTYNRKMNPDLERQAYAMLPEYVKHFATDSSQTGPMNSSRSGGKANPTEVPSAATGANGRE